MPPNWIPLPNPEFYDSSRTCKLIAQNSFVPIIRWNEEDNYSGSWETSRPNYDTADQHCWMNE